MGHWARGQDDYWRSPRAYLDVGPPGDGIGGSRDPCGPYLFTNFGAHLIILTSSLIAHHFQRIYTKKKNKNQSIQRSSPFYLVQTLGSGFGFVDLSDWSSMGPMIRCAPCVRCTPERWCIYWCMHMHTYNLLDVSFFSSPHLLVFLSLSQLCLHDAWFIHDDSLLIWGVYSWKLLKRT